MGNLTQGCPKSQETLPFSCSVSPIIWTDVRRSVFDGLDFAVFESAPFPCPDGSPIDIGAALHNCRLARSSTPVQEAFIAIAPLQLVVQFTRSRWQVSGNRIPSRQAAPAALASGQKPGKAWRTELQSATGKKFCNVTQVSAGSPRQGNDTMCLEKLRWEGLCQCGDSQPRCRVITITCASIK